MNALNRYFGILLIVLTVVVTLPLIILTISSGGGSWGFGIIGLGILLPLCTYSLFGIAGIVRRIDLQRKIFVIAHAVSLATGMACLVMFPLYPTFIVIVPLVLAFLGIVSRGKNSYYLLAMIILAIMCNVVLLKWEIDFHRSAPFLQLFESTIPSEI